VVAVPDPRLEKLSVFSNSKKTVPAAVEFVDIAGLVKGASEGEGLGNKFLANIRETDAIAEVVRLFEDENVIHVAGGVDPLRDIETINLELILADLQTVSKRLLAVGRDAKRGDKAAIAEETALRKLSEAFEAGRLASSVELSDAEEPLVRQLHLLTMKPILYVLNKKAGARNIDALDDGRWEKLKSFLESSGSRYVIVDAGIEHELKDIGDEERELFRAELGGSDDGIDNLIREGYRLLDLMTFFTTGEDETRAWTIRRNSTAPLAGAAIHGDFKDKFIRAEVIHSDTLLAAGSMAAAREKGLLRTEGKEYVVVDGDVIEFKI
jgi:GTP-binding protein YchF